MWFFLTILLLPKYKRVKQSLNYGVNLLGSRGNIDVFRILSRPKYSITTRSIPIPPPACGGHPKRKDSIYAAILVTSVKCILLFIFYEFRLNNLPIP